MANRITMSICGEDYTLVADESAAYMEKVGAMVDGEMRQLMDGARMSRDNAAVLAAVWCYFYPAAGACMVVVALLICALRVLAGAHYVRDVAAGALLGFALGAAGMWLL